MQNRRNYYRVLHVQPDAPFEIIRASHRTMMQVLRMHPDLGGEHWNATVINEAFATLIDPTRRAAYDRLLAREAAALRQSQPVTATVGTSDSCLFCGTGHPSRDAARPAAACDVCTSPLCRTSRQPHAASRRALARMPREAPVVLAIAWPESRLFGAVSEDVSVSGMRIVTAVELVPGDRVRLDCDFCSAVAIVRHVRRHGPAGSGQWHVGVEFLTLRIRKAKGVFVSTDV